MRLAVLFVLGGCARLAPGDYTLDYGTVDEDSCDLFQGGQVAADTTGELAWEGDTLVFELDGSDEDLEFDVSGTTFTREASGESYLADDGSCWLAVEQEDVGEMVSGAIFEGHTDWVGVLQGDCGVFDAWIDDPCTVAFDWRGERRE